MNRKRKWVLWALPFMVLSVALVWAKWKSEHPMPTERDIRLRQQFLKAERVVIINKNSHFTQLSAQERREIAEHLNIIWNGSAPTTIWTKWGSQYFNDDITIWWGKARGTHIVNAINLGAIGHLDYYRHSDSAGQFLPLHPATSRFLRQWLKNHPDILNAKN